jgi:hypothetical protein
MSKVKDATLIGFRLLIDEDRQICTEMTTVPSKDFNIVFSNHPDLKALQAAIYRATQIIKEAHEVIQKEMNEALTLG